MSDEQRTELRRSLRGDTDELEIPFARPGSLTRVYCVASGRGGVGKSSVTVNLAAAMASRGLSVGVLDADIYGHSVPRMLGVTAGPTRVQKMIRPPGANGVKVISVGMFTSGLSIAQLLPDSEILVVTTPQAAAAEVAVALRGIAERLSVRRRGLAGCRLPVSP